LPILHSIATFVVLNSKISPMPLENTNSQIPVPGVSKLDNARLLYMAGDKTQKSIAAAVGVSDRTMHSWIKDNGWDRLRHASRTAPAIIAENMFSQIVKLQNDIASREEGKRYPTMQEAELTRKLCLSIDKMKNAPALSQTMQALRLFRSFANGYGDRDFRLTLNRVIEHFLEDEAKNGYFPYQVEYGSNEDETQVDDSALSMSPGQTFSEHAEPGQDEETPLNEIENQPETSDHKTPSSPAKSATGATFTSPSRISGSESHQQKPEVKRKSEYIKAPRILQKPSGNDMS
jgi:hypothetical protein